MPFIEVVTILKLPHTMNVTLYSPNQQPCDSNPEGFTLPDTNGFAQVPVQAARLLMCTLELVDVLASSPDYVVYTIFDNEGLANPEATQAVGILIGHSFDTNSKDELLRGPVVIVKR